MCSVQLRNWFLKFYFGNLNVNSSVRPIDYNIGHHICIWTMWNPISSLLAAAEIAGWPVSAVSFGQGCCLANQLHLVIFCFALVPLRPFQFFRHTLLSFPHSLCSLPSLSPAPNHPCDSAQASKLFATIILLFFCSVHPQFLAECLFIFFSKTEMP